MVVLVGAVGVLALAVIVLAVVVVRLSAQVRAMGSAAVGGSGGARPASPAAPPSPPQRPGTQAEPHASGAPTAAVVAQGAGSGDHVITRLGEPDDAPAVVPNQVVLSATLGEPLVKVLALGHGVRRALGAEARNRIRFEMRREVKRARKDRRREMRVAWRQMRAQQAAAGGAETIAVHTVPQQRREDVA